MSNLSLHDGVEGQIRRANLIRDPPRRKMMVYAKVVKSWDVWVKDMSEQVVGNKLDDKEAGDDTEIFSDGGLGVPSVYGSALGMFSDDDD